MSRKYRIENPLDDYVILNNLDAFKAQIIAQSQFCDDVQDEMRKLTEKYNVYEKKYKRVKSEYKNFLVKYQQLENENAGIKSELEVYKLLYTNHLLNVNRPILNTIHNIPNIVPEPPTPPPLLSLLKTNNDISLGTQNKLPKKMDGVLDELRSKIKRFE
jgi:hypothetical protein